MNKPIMMALTAALVATLAACATNEPDMNSSSDQNTATTTALSGTINAGGASSQTAAQEAWRAGFQNDNPQVTINYDPTGSGTGRENFVSGGYALAGTDAAFALDQTTAGFGACTTDSGLVEIPAYISPIAIGFNLTGVDTLNLDAETIAKIFAGKLTTWNDPAIANQNPGVTLPNTAITPVHRSDQSGTTENFTDYLAKAAPTAWTFEAAQTWPTELTGEAAEKTQGVRSTITTTPGAVGYLDASQASDMGTVAVKVGTDYVSYSAAGAAAAVGQSPLQSGRAVNDIVVDLDRTLTGAGVYPVVLISYLAACETYADPELGGLVKAYLTYVISADGQQAAATNAGSAPLTGDANLSAKAAAAVASIQ